MPRQAAFIHSLQNGHGRRRRKYLDYVHVLLLASTHEVVVLGEEEVCVGLLLGGGIGCIIPKSAGTKILPNYYSVTSSVTRDSLVPYKDIDRLC